MDIDACTTWQCINSFAPWLAAIGTILISGLALWLSIRDRLLSVRAVFSLALIPGDDPNVLDREVFMLDFTNIGPRPVTVNSYGWKLPFSRKSLLFMPEMDPILRTLCSKLPLELTDGKSGHIFYKRDFFSQLEEPEKALFAKNRIGAFFRIWFFRIRINTTVGKRIKVYVQRAARERLWQQYKVFIANANARGARRVEGRDV